jgi:Spy/CpxP family protein refolding chaperone
MKKFSTLLLLIVALVSLGVVAQNSGMPPGHQMLTDPSAFADGHLAALDHQVQLTEAQKTTLRPVFLDEGQKLFAILNSTTMATEQKQASIEKLHEETAAKVNSLLTPQQRKQRGPSQEKPNPTSQT